MLRALSDSGKFALFQEAAQTLAEGVRADRAAIFHLDLHGEFALGGTHGIAPFPLDDSPFSLTLLREVLVCDRNIVYSDVPKETDVRDNVSL